MPYNIKKVKDGYKVVSKDNPQHVYAYHTKNPKALISAIEIAKHHMKKSKSK
jgi:hypothetical protein